MTNFLVVDDSPHIRRLVRDLIEAEPGWSVSGEAGDGKEAVVQCRILSPQMVIMDIHMPIMNGFDAAREIHQAFAATRILMLTSDDASHFSRAAMNSGAHGMLTKDRASHSFIIAVKALLRGEKYFTEHAAN